MIDSGIANKQRFAIFYFRQYFNELDAELILETFSDVFKRALTNGNVVIYDYVKENYIGDAEEEFKTYLESFSSSFGADDLPF